MATQIRFGGYQSAASVHTRAIAVFARALERRLGDDVVVEITANVAELGHKAADLLELVESGALDMCYFSSSYLAERAPALGVFDLPFAIEAQVPVHAALDGRARGAAQGGDRRGYRLSGARVLGQRHPPPLQPRAADPQTRGLRRPAPPDPAQRAPPRGLPRARLRATGDRPERAAGRGWGRPGRRPGEPADQLRELRNLPAPPLRHAVRSPFRGRPGAGQPRAPRRLAEAVRAGVRAALAEATAAQRGFARADDVNCLARLAEAGNQVLELAAPERAALVAAVALVVDPARARLDPDILDLLRTPA